LPAVRGSEFFWDIRNPCLQSVALAAAGQRVDAAPAELKAAQRHLTLILAALWTFSFKQVKYVKGERG
jgi:hypothetical protein